MRTLLSALALLACTAVQAAPIYYDATYDIYEVYGATPPADWGNVTVGATAQLHFGWDPDEVTNPADPYWDGGPLFSYVLQVGDGTISSGPMVAARTAGSTSISITDLVPNVCTPPAPCVDSGDPTFGDYFVDEVFFNFGCANWAGAPRLLPNLDCAGPLTGNLPFELFGPRYHEQQFGIRASLTALNPTAVPEPDALSLAALGLIGLWISKRKRA